MEFLLKGFAKEFQAKHGAPGNKKTKENQGQNVQCGHTQAAGNAAKKQQKKKKGDSVINKNSVNDKESSAAANCPHTQQKAASSAAAANKENLLAQMENPELNKKQRKKLRQKLRKQETKMLKENGATKCDQDLPTTSAKAQQSQSTAQKPNIQIVKKEFVVNLPCPCQALNNNGKQSTNTKKKCCEMSFNTNKDTSNNSKNKDTKTNSSKNMSIPSKVPNNDKDPAAKQQDEKNEKPFPTKSSDLLKPLQSKQPRHCELLKPLIFAVPEGQLLSWAKQIQNQVLSLVVNSKQTTPFYIIGRHFDMRSTVTADEKVLDLFKQFLEERDAGYFSYTPKEQLRSLLVLKKPAKLKPCNPTMVKDALLKLKISVLRVEVFKAMWKPEKSFNRYLVEVSRDTDLQKLFQQKTLLKHTDWQWNKLKNPSITQCRNCQRYGHVASNCKMPYRCVKCKNQHEAGKCTRNRKEPNTEPVYCHNCKKTGHPSNYRGCPAYKERLAALQRQRDSSRFSTVFKKAVMMVNKTLQESSRK